MDIREVEKRLKLQGKLRDFSWIVRQYEKGRLYIGGNKVSSKRKFEQFRVLIRLVNEIYENHWDIDFSISQVDDAKVIVNIHGPVIHFPHINIYNSRRQTHDISDLFVRLALVVGSSNLQLQQIQGGRATFTYAEWTSDYSHSHLPGRGNTGAMMPYYNRFCTGSGHINDFIAEINSGEVTEANLTRLLVQIMGLVNYESIEGTPYRHLSNISVRTQSGRRFSANKDTSLNWYRRLLNHHRENNLTPNIEFKLENGKYKLKDDSKFDAFLLSLQMDDNDKLRLLAFIDEIGNAYAYGHTPTYQSLGLPRSRSFIFRNREIPLTINSRPDEQNTSNIEYKIHPTIKQYIKEEIEYDINKKTIRKSTIDRYSNKTDNARACVTPNTVLVPTNS